MRGYGIKNDVNSEWFKRA